MDQVITAISLESTKFDNGMEVFVFILFYFFYYDSL